MKYVLLLRGVNVGGKNKVEMRAFREYLSGLGFTGVRSYINSGNFIFSSDRDEESAKAAVREMLAARYDFEILFVLLREETLCKAVEALPAWWNDGTMARRDVLFFTDQVDPARTAARIRAMKQYNEIVHYTDIAVFWGKINEKEYSKTAYHKYLLAEDFYRKVTIRNGNTLQRLYELLLKTEER